LFVNFTTNEVGAAAVELDADLIFKAVAKLRMLNVPAPYYGVFHPRAVYNLKKSLTQAGYNTNANAISDIGNEILRNNFIGTVAGVQIFENANIVPDASDDAYGAVFHPASLGLALKEDFKVETQRDASLRATEIVASITYGKGAIKQSYGCAVITDTTV
jgi:hypothetical protein